MNDIHSLREAYVVGAVHPDEAQEFEAHLAGCAMCVAQVAELRDLTARLSEAVATDPPPALRGTILSAIAATPQEQALSTSASSPTVHEPLSPHTPETEQTGTSGRHLSAVPPAAGTPIRRDEPPRRWSTLLVAAAVLAAIGFGGWAVQSREQARDLSAQNEQVLQQNKEFTELLSAQDVRAVAGRFTDGGTGSVVLSRSEGKAILIASDLPDLPADKTYEAWTIKGDPQPAGVFSDTESGAILELPDEVFDAQSVAVTIEPAGGSPKPTSDAVFTVSLPQR